MKWFGGIKDTERLENDGHGTTDVSMIDENGACAEGSIRYRMVWTGSDILCDGLGGEENQHKNAKDLSRGMERNIAFG